VQLKAEFPDLDSLIEAIRRERMEEDMRAVEGGIQ